jgi:UDP-N-acetylmuramate: L-alanyl-gamma-D-glutamyl-meso-diaminopimelate ligase
MIIHVLQEVGLECDYMVGAQLNGFEVMVKLTQTAKIMVIEGDEYLTSPIDRRPKFHLYKPNIGIISGIAWDHVNVFPTFDNYVEQFEIFASSIPENGKYIYCSDDQVLTEMSSKITQTEKVPYTFHPYSIKNGVTYLVTPFGDISLQVFGKHNLANINAAKHACLSVGVTEKQFYQAISSFKGASSRLELLESNAYCSVYKDFAHSPSKLKATIEAVKEQFDDRLIVACMELHTFSSLSEQFLKEYYGCMDKADMAIVFFNPEAIVHKKLPPISSKMVFDAFGRSDLEVLDNREKLESKLLNIKEKEAVFIMMSSGNFNGIDLQAFSKKLVLLRN